MKQLAELTHIPLADAFLCLDCQSLHNSNSWCPACSSSTIVILTKWISEMATKYAEKETVNG